MQTITGVTIGIVASAASRLNLAPGSRVPGFTKPSLRARRGNLVAVSPLGHGELLRERDRYVATLPAMTKRDDCRAARQAMTTWAMTTWIEKGPAALPSVRRWRTRQAQPDPGVLRLASRCAEKSLASPSHESCPCLCRSLRTHSSAPAPAPSRSASRRAARAVCAADWPVDRGACGRRMPQSITEHGYPPITRSELEQSTGITEWLYRSRT